MKASLDSLRAASRMPTRAAPSQECVATGHAGVDRVLGGGLARGRVHELFAGEAEDSGSAAGFAAMLARQQGGEIVWLREERAERHGGAVYPPGLAAIGIDPARLILAVLPDALTLLRAATDVVRCAGVGVAVIELWRNAQLLDLTASRRLALAAEQSGVTPLVLRIGASPAPSAAQTRWTVRAAPSRALAADAPGHPALDVEITRQRGRPPGGLWTMEWDRDRVEFRDGAQAIETDGPAPPLSGAMVSFPAGGPVAADGLSFLRSA